MGWYSSQRKRTMQALEKAKWVNCGTTKRHVVPAPPTDQIATHAPLDWIFPGSPIQKMSLWFSRLVIECKFQVDGLCFGWCWVSSSKNSSKLEDDRKTESSSLFKSQHLRNFSTAPRAVVSKVNKAEDLQFSGLVCGLVPSSAVPFTGNSANFCFNFWHRNLCQSS